MVGCALLLVYTSEVNVPNGFGVWLEWTQAEDCIKFFDYISDTGINDNDVVVGPVRLAKQAYGIN